MGAIVNDAIYGGAEQFARIVEATTAGKFKISVAGSGEIVPGPGAFLQLTAPDF